MDQVQFADIVQFIQESRANAIKVVNSELINLYWNVGGYIHRKVEAEEWGKKTVERLADYIKVQHPDLKGFNRRGLYRMKQFYETYAGTSIVSATMTQSEDVENEMNIIVSLPMTQFRFTDIRQSILTKTSWTHHLVLLSRTKSEEERTFYLNLAPKEHYSVKELERQINSSLFERTITGKSVLSSSINNDKSEISHYFKDTYIFEFLNLPEKHNELDLQRALVDQMKNFILELGRDFLFIGQEYRLQVGNSDFYIDLLFYHRGLQCLVAFELKTDKFKPEQLGQLNFYLEALDRDVKKQNENPSIGILLCKDKDKEVVEYALSRSLSPAMVAEYNLQLPDKALLQRKLHELFEKESLN